MIFCGRVTAFIAPGKGHVHVETDERVRVTSVDCRMASIVAARSNHGEIGLQFISLSPSLASLKGRPTVARSVSRRLKRAWAHTVASLRASKLTW